MSKIWGRNTSANVPKVMWALAELGLHFERVDVGGAFGLNREPAYLELNPNGLVPTLEEEDDGFVLWESNAIVRYLAERYPGPLDPGSARGRGVAGQWMDWELSILSPTIRPLFWGLVRTAPADRDMAAIDAAREKTTEAFAMVDRWLGSSPFLAGDAFSFGDIPVAVMARRYRELVPDRPDMPNLERWFAEIETREGFQSRVAAVPMQ